MRASPTTPAMVRRIQAAVEEYVSIPATGRGPLARLQRWGRRLTSGQRSAIVVLGTLVPGITAMLTLGRSPEIGVPCLVVAIIAFWVAIAGVEGGSRWYRAADRAIAVMPRPMIFALVVLVWALWFLGALVLWVGSTGDAVLVFVLAAVLLGFAWGYSSPVLAVERVQPRVVYSTAADTTARLILLLSVVLVATWLWWREGEQKAATEIITLVLAIVGLLGVAMLRGLTRRRHVLSQVVRAADDLYSTLQAADLDPATLIATGLTLDRAMSTRLTSGLRLLGHPVADTRLRGALIALVHLVAGRQPPPSADGAITLLLAKATDLSTIRDEIVGYCLHVRALLRTRVDIAA